jgi:tetratricopeptide (TPR) repeat protein
MVANQSGVNMILSFGVKSVNPEILEKLLIGRQKAADYLYDAAKSIAEDGNNQHILVIGQRGMGKTHLLRVLFHRLQQYIKDDKIVVAYFSEEEYGIASYFDFLIRILNSFLKWNEEDRENIKLKIIELQNTSFPSQISKAEEIIEDFCAGKPLLILAENFSDILAALNSRNEQGKLRSWLYTSDRVSIIATSQALSNDFDKESRPFFGFFTNYYLKNLTFPESLEFLIQLSILDGKEEVTDYLKHKGRSQIKALYDLVKGNHRLLVTFYEFLKTDTLAKLSTHFIKTINDLKPYYESFIRYLPPQQQKILRYIALSRKPQNGVDICKNCFIEQRTFSKQISELTKKRLVETITDPTDGRNRLYDINEPLLRISIEVGEHREGITALFIDFLAIFYSQEELSERKAKFIQQQQACANEKDIMEINYEINALNIAIELKNNDYHISDDSHTKQKIKLLNKEADKQFKNNEYAKCIETLDRIIELNQAESNTYFNCALALTRLAQQKNEAALFQHAIKKFQEAITIDPNQKEYYNEYGNCLADLAQTTHDEKLYFECFDQYQQAVNINIEFADAFYNWGTVLGSYARLKMDKDLFLGSIDKLTQAIKIKPDYFEAYNNLGVIQLALAKIEYDRQLFPSIISSFQKSVEINSKNFQAYFNLGKSLYYIALKEKDSNFLLQSIDTFLAGYKINAKPSCLENINESMIQILKFASLGDKVDFNYLKELTTQYQTQFPEFKITEKYIDVFQKYVVEGDKKALYSLPKEQREFFKKEILGEE